MAPTGGAASPGDAGPHEHGAGDPSPADRVTRAADEEDDPSTLALIKGLLADGRALVSARVELAKAEATARVGDLKLGAALLGAAVVIGLAIANTFLIGLVFVLALWLPLWLALALVLVAFGGLAAFLARAGVRRLAHGTRRS